MNSSLHENNSDKKYIYYKWSKNDEVFKKSLKNKKVIDCTNDEKKDFIDYRSFSKSETKDINDKNIFNDRLTDREKMIQTSINPYLSNNNYLSDLKTQNDFLRPKNSSYEKYNIK